MDCSSRWQFADTYGSTRGKKLQHFSIAKRWCVAIVTALVALGALAVSATPGSTAATMKTYVMPTTVPHDCSVDVTAILNYVIGALPDNTMLSFPANGCYQIDGTVRISGKHGLTLNANNSTFRAMTNGSELPAKQARTRDQFLVINSTNVTITNAIAYGDNPHAGLSDSAYNPAFEAQHGFEISSSSYVTLDHVQAYNVYGDFVYIGGGGTVPSRYVTVKDSTFRANGRIGITIANATDVTINHNSLDQMRRSVFDLEPYAKVWVIERVTIQNNTIGAARLNFFSDYGNCAVVDTIQVLQNQLIGQELNGEVLNGSTCTTRRRNFTFAGNTSNKAQGTPSGMALEFAGVDGITLTNNIVPLQPGRNMHLARLTNSTLAAATNNALPGGAGTIFTNDGSNLYCYSNNTIGDPLTLEPTTKPCN